MSKCFDVNLTLVNIMNILTTNHFDFLCPYFLFRKKVSKMNFLVTSCLGGEKLPFILDNSKL